MQDQKQLFDKLSFSMLLDASPTFFFLYPAFHHSILTESFSFKHPAKFILQLRKLEFFKTKL
jgi:hypothetical protein